VICDGLWRRVVSDGPEFAAKFSGHQANGHIPTLRFCVVKCAVGGNLYFVWRPAAGNADTDRELSDLGMKR